MSDAKKHILILSGWDISVHGLSDLPVDITLFQSSDKVSATQYKTAKRVVVTDVTDQEEMMSLAKALHQHHPFDAVVSFYEPCLQLASWIGGELGIKANPLRPVELTMDKRKMRDAMHGTGIPTIPHQVCQAKEEAADFLERLRAPIILKPTGGSGSSHVSLVRSAEELDAAWAWSSAAEGELIAEEYVDGNEYSVECLSTDGCHQVLAITAKSTTGTPHFIETGHVQPAMLEPSLRQEIEACILKFLDLIGQENGPTHTEIKVRGNTPYIIESHTRYGGDRVWELTYLSTGLHIQKSTVCQLLGLPILQHEIACPAVAIRFLMSEPKVCQEVRGVEEARAQAGVRLVAVDVKPGDIIRDLSSSSDRCGYVVADGETVEEAVRRAEGAAGLIQIL